MQSGPTAQPPTEVEAHDHVTGPSTGALRLRDPRHRVHPRSILWWTLRPLVFWLVVTLGQTAALIFASPAPGFLPTTLTISIVLAVVHIVVMPQWRYRVHRWEATGEAVYTRSGWINQEWRVAPVSRIQTIDTKRGPLEQLLGLATVTITTASAAGPVEIAGLAHEEATRLVDELTATTQATPGDAT